MFKANGVLEKTPESSLDCKEIKPDNPKRNQPWVFIGRADAETEAPILWPPDAKNLLISKYYLLITFLLKRDSWPPAPPEKLWEHSKC